MTKFINTRKIDTRKWTFLKDGVDDFRSGLPSCSGDVLVKGNSNLNPILTNVKPKKSTEQLAAKQRPPDANSGAFRATLMQQQRQKNVEAVENILKQHPLALYPHLEECLPPELFEDVVNILDPEMSVASDTESAYQDNGRPSGHHPATHANEGKMVDEPVEIETADIGEVKVPNPYRWLPEGDDSYKKDKKNAAEQQKSSAREDEEHIQNVTQEFCDWVSSLGGDSNNIDESTITSLFASGYETKPALSVPIHVVELASVPPELRMAAAPVPPSTPGGKATTPQTSKPDPSTSRGGPKYKYGAWYLDPKMWKKQPAGEPLRDPNDTKDQELSEAKQKSLKVDHELATMSGVKLFMDFVGKKDTRRPEFLDHVADIHAQQQKDELVHQDPSLVRPKYTRNRSTLT